MNIENFELASFIFVIGIIFFFTHSLYFFDYGKSEDKRKLSFMFLFVCLQMGYNFFYKYFGDSVKVGIEIFNLPIILSITPSAFMYVSKITDYEFSIKKHFAIPIIFLILNLFAILFIPFQEFLLYAKSFFIDYRELHIFPKSIYFVGVFIILTGQIFYYIYRILSLLKKHQINIGNNFAYTEGINLRWLIALCILMFIYFGLGKWLVHYPTSENFIIYNFTTGFIFYGIYFLAINQDKVFDFENDTLENIVDDREKLKNKLIILCKEEKVYLEEKITLSIIAKKIGTNRTYLSEVLNNSFGKNFNDFINEYRVKYSKKLLLNTDLPIEIVAIKSGFNNISTFYNAFKKVEKTTPSAFRKNKL